MYNSYWPATGTVSWEPTTTPGNCVPSSVESVTDCQNCLPASSRTVPRSSPEMMPVDAPNVEKSCGATVDASCPGTRNTAISRLDDAAVIWVRAEPSRVCTCTRSAASEEFRMPCAAVVARFDSSSTWLSLDWNRSLPMLTDMYTPTMAMATPESSTVM